MPRLSPSRRTTVPGHVSRLSLPHGCFNAALEKLPLGGYILVYRRDEYRFVACRLDAHLDVIQDSHTLLDLGAAPVADPRLIWMPDGSGRLFLIYSSLDFSDGVTTECMRGAVLIENEKLISKPQPYLLSPKNSRARQKNWMPFCCSGVNDTNSNINDQQLYLIASVCPHVVFSMDCNTFKTEQVSVWQWSHCWEPRGEFLRGNTQAVLLDDGNYLGTFHSGVREVPRGCVYYDNGVVIFDSKLPFKILRCSDRSVLPAEAAIEKHFRKLDLIRCVFPLGAVRDGPEDLLVSWGDNDSAVKISRFKIKDLLDTTVEVYDF